MISLYYLNFSWAKEQIATFYFNYFRTSKISFLEYGTLCYRKNPQHRREYKHTVKPRAAKRKAAIDARKRAKKRKADYVSGDSESYESDFIDDSDIDEKDISSDEEDVDEWKPDDEDEID